MTEASLQNIEIPGTRLLRLLSDMAVSEISFTQTHFSERLGRLIDIGESMKLSAFHDQLQEIVVEPDTKTRTSATAKEEVLRIRLLLVKSIVESFVPSDGSTRIELPTLKAGVPLEQLATFDPYQGFYLAHQREFEYKLQRLQLRVRSMVNSISTDMAQLAALDEVIRNTLLPHTRKCLSVIPKLLGKRFDFLLQEYLTQHEGAVEEIKQCQPNDEILQTWIQADGWLSQFLKEMQGLLLADLELRLQPVLGLLEAVDKKVEKE